MFDTIPTRGGRTVRLQDVVERHQEISRDPVLDGYRRFLKVEHMDQGVLRVSRWGDTEKEELPPTFHNVFRSGDVLFPSRNPHLRRAVWPDFDGICGEKTFVLKAREGLYQGLLPFIMQSDALVRHAVRMMIGSTNPHVRWRDLASFEFALPPDEEQRRIADLLGTLQASENSYTNLCVAGMQLLWTATESLCWSAGWSLHPVGTIADPTVGGFRDGDWIESRDQSPEGIRLLQLADIGEGVFLDRSRRYVSNDTFSKLNCTEVKAGDLLIARMADPIGRTCILPHLSERCITAVDCCIVRINGEEHDPRYWVYVLNSPSWKRLTKSAAAGSTRFRISRSNLEEVLVPVPTYHNQCLIAEQLESIANAKTRAATRDEDLKGIRRRILGGLTGGSV